MYCKVLRTGHVQAETLADGTINLRLRNNIREAEVSVLVTREEAQAIAAGLNQEAAKRLGEIDPTCS